MEKIAMWGGIAGIVVAIFAIVILYLTRSNIIDLLDRDVVMYDKNFEIKKDALNEAFNCLDVLAKNGTDVKSNPQYLQRAKEAYNALLCCVNSPKIYQEFYRMAIDSTASATSGLEIEKFKISCRTELMARRKNKAEGFKGNDEGGFGGIMRNQIPQQPMQRPAQVRAPQPNQIRRPSNPNNPQGQ